MLLIGATSVFGELQDALDRIWRAPVMVGPSGFWRLIRARLMSFGMVLGIGFLLMVSLVASAALAALRKWWGPLFSDWAVAASIIEVGSSFLVITVIFAMIYKMMPRVRIDWKDVWIGAAATSLLFTVGKFLIVSTSEGAVSLQGLVLPHLWSWCWFGSITRPRSSC